MGWSNILLQLSPLIVDLVQIAEKAFSGVSQSGAQKRNFVCSAAKDIIAGGNQVATGGAKGTWSFIDKFAPPLIDVVAKHLFPEHEKIGITNAKGHGTKELLETFPEIKPHTNNQFIDNDKYR